MLMGNPPTSVMPAQAEGCSDPVLKLLTIDRPPCTTDETMRESYVLAGGNLQFVKVEVELAFCVGLPLAPTFPVCFCTFVLQRRKHIIDDDLRLMVPQYVILNSFPGGSSPLFQYLADLILRRS